MHIITCNLPKLYLADSILPIKISSEGVTVDLLNSAYDILWITHENICNINKKIRLIFFRIWR